MSWTLSSSPLVKELRFSDVTARVEPLVREDKVETWCAVAIIGVGGVGFWAAYSLALSRLVERLILYDGDVLEPHNLTRIPGNELYINARKVELLRDLIEDLPYSPRIVTRGFLNPLNVDELFDAEVVIECTDDPTIQEAIAKLSHPRKIQVHYDGYNSITIAVNNPLHSKDWGPTPRYAVVPALPTAAMIAGSLAAHYAVMPDLVNKRFAVRVTLNPLEVRRIA